MQCRIVAQFLVVIEVFIPQGKGAESLPHECQCGGIAARLASRVGQCFVDCGGQTQLLIDLRQEGNPPMTGDVSPAEISFDFAAFDGGK